VQIFDTSSGKDLAVISIGEDQVNDIVAATYGTTVYAAHSSIYSPYHLHQALLFPPRNRATNVFSPDGSQAYLESSQNGQSGVAVVDTSMLAVTGFVPGI
jgi:hypothetical protein